MQTSGPSLIPDTFIKSIEAQILSPLITLLALGAFILFAFGVFELIRKGGNEEARIKGRQHVMWGLIGLAILFGASVIVQILQNIAGSFKSL
ncbi:MAG TPA: hypothetical protein VN086_00225 [Candidatus Paceibacterota bacterium]|nr:hypothetical protein [Candidatus Paceibacterota bacterium]